MDFKYDSTKIMQVLKTMRETILFSPEALCYVVQFKNNILFNYLLI